jgi:hypothetical protein
MTLDTVLVSILFFTNQISKSSRFKLREVENKTKEVKVNTKNKLELVLCSKDLRELTVVRRLKNNSDGLLRPFSDDDKNKEDAVAHNVTLEYVT